MDLQLVDKTIFVAGGSRGIGLGIVEACLDEGARVAITARGAKALEVTRAELAGRYGEDRVRAFVGDMTDSAVINRLLAETEDAFGPIWGAVGNVGLHPCPHGFEITDDIWRGGFAQNLDSAFYLGRAALRSMVPRGGGSLLFISS